MSALEKLNSFCTSVAKPYGFLDQDKSLQKYKITMNVLGAIPGYAQAIGIARSVFALYELFSDNEDKDITFQVSMIGRGTVEVLGLGFLLLILDVIKDRKEIITMYRDFRAPRNAEAAAEEAAVVAEAVS